MKKLLSILPLAALATASEDSYYHRKGEQEITISKEDLAKKFPVKKQNMREFVFPLGFKCFALNQKSADKKYAKWLESNKN